MTSSIDDFHYIKHVKKTKNGYSIWYINITETKAYKLIDSTVIDHGKIVLIKPYVLNLVTKYTSNSKVVFGERDQSYKIHDNGGNSIQLRIDADIKNIIKDKYNKALKNNEQVFLSLEFRSDSILLDVVGFTSTLPISDKLKKIYKKKYLEGKKRLKKHSSIERNIGARKEAIRIHGTVCHVCGFQFSDRYGELGNDFIEIHHIIPLSKCEEVEINPETDLIPLCSNCHRMIHKLIKKSIDEINFIDELKQLLK